MNEPHLTPEKLLCTNVLPPNWAKAKIAFICFTPFPQGFVKYVRETASSRFLLHSPNAEVRLCEYEEIPFIVISEVYGFPVGATTVEELIHYGIRKIIGIGYAGAFDTVPIGTPFIAVDTIADLPQAAHYGVRDFERCSADKDFLKHASHILDENGIRYEKFTLWNSNSLYRETPQLIQCMKDKGCQAVNMDVLSLYAVAPVCAEEKNKDISYLYVGTVTDSEGKDDIGWESDLAEVVKGTIDDPHDKLVQFMVEKIILDT